MDIIPIRAIVATSSAKARLARTWSPCLIGKKMATNARI